MESLETRQAERKKRRQLEAQKRESVVIQADTEFAVDLSQMRKAELLAHAATLGVDTAGMKTNVEIITAIEAADQSDAEKAPAGGNPWDK